MKRWACLTVLLYALALALLTLPVALIAFGNWGKNESHFGLPNVLQGFYLNWGYWLWLAVLVSGQWLLLGLPLRIAERRLPARRPLKTPVIVTAFFLANLCLAGIFALLCALFTDQTFDYVNLFSGFGSRPNGSGTGTLCTMLITLLLFWVVWAAIFFRHRTASGEPQAHFERMLHWLLNGSILELLVAVPCHVIVRRRDDCCAPAGTFWGIATGISVMLLCFGPGVFFLFARRMKALKPESSHPKMRPEGQ